MSAYEDEGKKGTTEVTRGDENREKEEGREVGGCGRGSHELSVNHVHSNLSRVDNYNWESWLPFDIGSNSTSDIA